jgi:hypothetical protein
MFWRRICQNGVQHFAGGIVDEAVREKFVRALEESFCKAGANSYEDGINSASKIVNFVAASINEIHTKDALRAMLDALPPISRKEEMTVLLATKLLPQLLRIIMKGALMKAQKTLPPPPGGRPLSLPPERREELLDFVASLNRRGFSMPNAKRRASAHFQISLRTVERLWLNRMTPNETEPTLESVLQYLSNGGKIADPN